MDLQEDPHTGEILWQHLVPVSNELAGVLTKMVHYHFKDRYQSASEVLQALQSISSLSTLEEDSKNSSYQSIKSLSSQSRQKTIAVAPAYPLTPASADTKLVKKSSGDPDILHLLILIGLALGAAAVAPVVGKNVQNVTQNFTGKDSSLTQSCLAVVMGNSYLRSEPSSINSDTEVKNVTKDTAFEVTGKRTKHSWIQVKLDPKHTAWAHSDMIKNNEEWVSCLRDKGIAVKTVDDRNLIGEHSTPKPKLKPIVSVSTPSPEKSNANTDNSGKILIQARRKYESGDLQGAIALLKSIASDPSAIKQTADMIGHWQQDWEQAETVFNNVNTAIAQGKWDKVLSYKDKHENLPNIQYWRDKLQPLFQQASENLTKRQPLQIGTLKNQTASKSRILKTNKP